MLEEQGGRDASAQVRVLALRGDEPLPADTPAYFAELARGLPHAHVTFAEDLQDALVGTLVAPLREQSAADGLRCCFLLEERRLVTVGSPEAVRTLLERAQSAGGQIKEPADALAACLEQAARSYPERIAAWRLALQDIEEPLVDGEAVDRRALMGLRRTVQTHAAHCEELSDVADALAEWRETQPRCAGDRGRTQRIARALGRLARELDGLDQYSLELASLYQDGIDVQQNRVMQWLTVIATIFMPLTFVTSWYGMNFPHMAMPETPWGYAAVVTLCLAIAAAEVLWFHRRGWLRFGDNPRERKR